MIIDIVKVGILIMLYPVNIVKSEALKNSIKKLNHKILSNFKISRLGQKKIETFLQ